MTIYYPRKHTFINLKLTTNLEGGDGYIHLANTSTVALRGYAAQAHSSVSHEESRCVSKPSANDSSHPSSSPIFSAPTAYAHVCHPPYAHPVIVQGSAELSLLKSHSDPSLEELKVPSQKQEPCLVVLKFLRHGPAPEP